ncbi:hypothetical protein STLA111740_18675 [Stenotrophomonas lactitubi]
MRKLNLLALPVCTFLSFALWGFAALVPFAPKLHEGILWVPLCIMLASFSTALVSIAIQDRVSRLSVAVSSLATLRCSWCLPILMLTAICISVVLITGARQLDYIILFASLALVAASAVLVLFEYWFYQARVLPTAWVIALHCGSIALSVFLHGRSLLHNLSIASSSWFVAAILILSLSVIIVGRYWSGLLRDPAARFSPYLSRLLKLLTLTGAVRFTRGPQRLLGKDFQASVKGRRSHPKRRAKGGTKRR